MSLVFSLLTMLSGCIVICMGFGLISTAPLNYNDVFPNYDSGYKQMVRASRHLPSPDVGSLFLEEANGVPNDGSVYRENNDLIRLPTLASDDLVDPLPQSSYFQHGIQATLPLEYGLINQNMPSPIFWDSKYLRAPYETVQDSYAADDAQNMGSMNIEMNPYEVDLYPFVHSSISAALNPVPPVHSLPPVYTTHIHEKMPSLDSRGDYDIDVLNPENSELLPQNLRITRSRRDFMEDLAHDAIINNILPTMSVPFVRGAERSPSYVSQAAQTVDPVVAVYQNRVLPILLNCSLSSVRGEMSNTYAAQIPQVVPAGVAYKQAKQRHE